jgi:serine/threonine protein phosphatase 1
MLKLFAKKRTAQIPAGLRVYAIGDIHGRADLLDRLIAAIREERKATQARCMLVYLGDYVDRGMDSRGVIERLSRGSPDYTGTCLRGNHDQAVLDFLEDPSMFRLWRDYGARETLVSYGVMPPRFDDEAEFRAARDRLDAAMPPAHKDFLAGLKFNTSIGDYFFVHAGVRPGVALDRQSPDDMMRIRDEFLRSGSDFGAVVVHGHTPMERPVKRDNRLSLDTGAYATGRLTAAVLEGDTCRFLQT